MTEPDGLRIERTTHGAWQVLVLSGELDLYTRSALGDRLTSSEDHARVALDLAGVRFIDSSGLGTIVVAVQRFRAAGGSLALVAPPGSPVARMLELAGLSDLLRPLADRTGQ
ncbi:MAG: STAS domain-containing protein [Planctomycetaceae bacterium]